MQLPRLGMLLPMCAINAAYGYCCDVMEHIPTEFTMLVVRNLLDVCRTVWFQIAFAHDAFGAFVGEPLHLTVQTYQWWHDRIGSVGQIIEARDLCGTGLFVVTR